MKDTLVPSSVCNTGHHLTQSWPQLCQGNLSPTLRCVGDEKENCGILPRTMSYALEIKKIKYEGLTKSINKFLAKRDHLTLHKWHLQKGILQVWVLSQNGSCTSLGPKLKPVDHGPLKEGDIGKKDIS